MTLEGMQLAVAPGDGLVARFGGVVLVAVDGGAESVDPLVSQALDSCRDLASQGEQPGDLLAERLAFLLGRTETPSVCALAWGSDGLRAVLQGELDLWVSRGHDKSRHRGSQPGSWLDLLIDGNFDSLAVGRAGSEPIADPRIDLGDGVIPGGGILIYARGNGTAVVSTEPVGEPGWGPPPPPDYAAATGPAAAPPPVPGAPRPSPEAPPADVAAGPVCSDGHANPAGARFCATCGRPLGGPEPSPAGVLVFDDGSSVTLDATYVVGREPGDSGTVRSGHARPLVIDDPDMLISRIHAEVRVDQGVVSLVDRDSTHGTYVCPPGGTAWDRVAPNVAVRLEPGTHVLVGRRSFLYQARVEPVDLR